MLNVEWIKARFEGYFDVEVNLPDTKAALTEKYGSECLSFEYESNTMSDIANNNLYYMVRSFMGMAYLKVKDRDYYSCFEMSKVDIRNFTYGNEGKKLTKVLSEVLECCNTLADVPLYFRMRHELNYRGELSIDTAHYFDVVLGKDIAHAMRAVGPLPRAFQDNPLSMTPAQFTAWLGEQYKVAVKGQCTTYYIDFRPMASLLAGNGDGFGSCYGLPCFPHRESDCYNSSPSAYAMCPDTAIIYSKALDGESLTGRAWLYFTPDQSLYFGRLYGSITKDACIRGAELLGYDVKAIMYEPYSVYSIASGNAYLSDTLALGFGPCSADHEKLLLRCTCISCGNRYIKSGSDCLCDKCKDHQDFCPNCGAEIDESESVYIEGVGSACTHCASSCADCGEWYLQDDLHDIGGMNRYHYMCESCLENYSYCEDCQEYVSSDEINYIESADRQVCDYCMTHNYEQCNTCHEWFYNDEILSCNDCGDSICESCAQVCNHCQEAYCNDCMEDSDHCTICAAELVEAEEESEEAEALA